MPDAAVPEDDGGNKGHVVNTRKRKANNGIYIEEPMDATHVRQAPLQSHPAAASGGSASSAKKAEPSTSAPKRRKRGFNPLKASG